MICLKLEDGSWFDAWECDASVEAGGYTLALGAVRYLAQSPSGWTFARAAVGYGWLELDGYADDLRYVGTAGAPMLEASVGVEAGFLRIFGLTVEAGFRIMHFSKHDVDLYAEGTTDMDAELARFLAEGTTDFSGVFIRASFGFRY
jgi:hypothetical protein